MRVIERTLVDCFALDFSIDRSTIDTPQALHHDQYVFVIGSCENIIWTSYELEG